MNAHTRIARIARILAPFLIFNCHTTAPCITQTLISNYCSTNRAGRRITLGRGDKVRRDGVRPGTEAAKSGSRSLPLLLRLEARDADRVRLASLPGVHLE